MKNDLFKFLYELNKNMSVDIIDIDKQEYKKLSNYTRSENLLLMENNNILKMKYVKDNKEDSDFKKVLTNEDKVRKYEKERYMELFKLYTDFEKEKENKEIIIGRGILEWELEGVKIKYPIFTANGVISFNADNAEITINADMETGSFSFDMLNRLDIKGKKEVKDLFFDKQDLNVLYNDEDFIDFENLLNKTINFLDLNGRYYKSEPETKDSHLIIYDQIVLIMKDKERKIIRKDLEKTLELLEDGKLLLPNNFKRLMEDFSEEKEYSPKVKEKEYYFPLPSNEEQRKIAEILENSNGVIVQGPPGTGKTHTIVNLVCDLLTQGKKILITSQKENALQVLKDKMPVSIQNLCVPILGSTMEAKKNIEKSINMIGEKRTNLNIKDVLEDVQKYKKDLKNLKKQESQINEQIKKYLADQNAGITYKNVLSSQAEVAKMVYEYKGHDYWIKDFTEEKFPLSEDELKQLVTLIKETNKSSYLNKDKTLLKREDIFDNATYINWINEGLSLEKERKSLVSKNNIYGNIDSEELEKLTRKINDVFNYFENTNELVCKELANKITNDLTILDFYKEELLDIEKDTKKKKLIEKEILSLDIQLPASNKNKLKEDIDFLIDIKEEKKDNILFFLTKGRKLKYIMKESFINNQPIETLDELKSLRKKLEKEEIEKSIFNKIRTLFGDLSFLDFDKNKISNLLLKEINDFINAAFILDSLLKDHFLKAKDVKNFFTASYLKEKKLELENAQIILREKEWQKEYLNQISFFESIENPHPIMRKMLTNLKDKKTKTWGNFLEQISLEERERANSKKIDIYLNKLEKFPKTRDFIFEKNLKNIGDAKDLENLYLNSKVKKSLEEIEKIDIESLEDALQKNKDKQRKIVEKIVENMAWTHQIKSMKSEEIRALKDWNDLMKKYGKGQGKNSNKILREARERMKDCQSAIPVWIMPVDKVAENFPAGNDKFDVVIFDESSQCDIFSLATLIKGKKAVIVGDDEQVSPTNAFRKIEDIDYLRDTYLGDLKAKSLIDYSTSLYDLAKRMYGEERQVMLKEHFRCVPEIIHFSNDLSYHGRMIPLRIASKKERLEDPVLAIKVSGGFVNEKSKTNQIEAEEIAKDIANMLKDKKYKDQSIGVITLQEKKQIKVLENEILKLVGAKEYQERKIKVGDASQFQGDERDIIFLSLVVANNVSYRALTTNEYKQRFNVAMSRARNQVRLYHSVDLDDLSKDDLRYKILSYCQNPHRENSAIKEIEELCDSVFEIEVARAIINRGYKVIPQYEVKNFRIDLVIEGMNSKLAVECDGDKYHLHKIDEDLERQRILERVGWTFWRLRGTDFYRDKENSLKSLWEKLDRMGIEKLNKKD